ncbi:hypothetical protein BJY52DRAFT_588756 [Lactarius psammicola]|nr:hypothetical protein BJY52DRAFT_588756 [Lactarius psammicola]
MCSSARGLPFSWVCFDYSGKASESPRFLADRCPSLMSTTDHGTAGTDSESCRDLTRLALASRNETLPSNLRVLAVDLVQLARNKPKKNKTEVKRLEVQFLRYVPAAPKHVHFWLHSRFCRRGYRHFPSHFLPASGCYPLCVSCRTPRWAPVDNYPACIPATPHSELLKSQSSALTLSTVRCPCPILPPMSVLHPIRARPCPCQSAHYGRLG